MRPIRLLAPLLLVAPLAAQEVGTRLSPALQVENMAQTPAKQLSDFAGRALVIEFFAHWCGPCARAVPHMNEIMHEYEPRGLSIVSVTNDPPAKAEPWVKKNGMEYGYGYDPKSKLQAHFGINSIPHAILIDAFGTIVWKGHPMQMPRRVIEDALQGVAQKPVWEWPEAARPLAQALWSGDWQTAERQAAENPAAAAILVERVGAVLKHFEGLVEQKEYSDAMAFGTRMRAEFGELAAGKALAEGLEKLRADPVALRLIEGEARLDELEAEARAARKISVLEEIQPRLAALITEFPGTRIARRAEALKDEIEKALARHK